MIKPIHETIIRDIVDVAQDLKDFDPEVDGFLNRSNNKSFGSITSKAKGLVMVFPVICSNFMSYETAMLISKATERKAVVLLSMLFQAACISDVDNAEEFIRQFHTNLRTGRMTMDDFGRLMDGFAESTGAFEKMDALALQEYNTIMDDLKSMNCYFEDNLSDYSIDDFKYVTSPLGENTLISTAITEAKGDSRSWITFDKQTTDSLNNISKALNKRAGYMNDDKEAQIAKNTMDAIAKDQQVAAGRIMDSEIKKANELVPTLMYVNFYAGDENIFTSAVVGVKAKLYVCDSEDIMNRLEVKNSDKNLLLNLVKVSSREISFFRDFVFAIDRAKIDALSQSRRGSSSKLWKVLERRAVKSKIRRALSMTNDATAITTLAITKEEVEYLKKTRYIDVENPRIITRIMDAYNMMGFVIADESLEICKFLYDDGEGEYETITYNGLEREQKDNTKKIVNLMSKMSR